MSYQPPPPPPEPPAREPDPAPAAAPARARRRGRPIVVGAAVAVLATGGAALAIGGGGQEPATAAGAPVTKSKVQDTDDGGLGAIPKSRPKLVQPVAGETQAEDPTADLAVAPADDGTTPKVTGPASSSTRADVAHDPGVSGLKETTATALPNGVALPPLEAPEAVLDVIRAGNIIARSPYKWGGGHGNFQDNGYDCSGSVTYALYFAGLIDGSHTSGELMAYGKPGPGKWITIYTNPGHVYMEVAGVRFDTSGQRTTGSRWQAPTGNRGGYEVRHPEGY